MKKMILICSIFFPLLSWGHLSFHIQSEPHSLNPAHIYGSSGRYLFHALYQTLYRYDNEKGLVAHAAAGCNFRTRTLIQCQLNSNLKFSNHQPIEAKNYIWAIQRLLLPNTKTIQSQLVLNIKNAKQILKGQLPITSLGVKRLNPSTFTLQLSQPDPEFLYHFLHPALSPVPQLDYSFDKENLITSGAYKIKSWTKGYNVILQPNPHYFNYNKDLPDLTLYFIDNHETAFLLYQKGQLNFLKLLSTSKLPKLIKNPELFFSPFVRFDYLGFGEPLTPFPNLRKALALSLDYQQFKKLVYALGRAGCIGIPDEFSGPVKCYEFNLKKAKAALKKVPKKALKIKLKLYFSKVGGESIRTAMEWMQNQWKKNLGLNIELIPVESGMLTSTIRNQKPTLFRKGVDMSKPTCRGALDLFTSNHPANFIHLKDKKMEQYIQEINQRKNNLPFCAKAINHLLDSYRLIPLGKIHFAMLKKPYIEGLKINYLNQINFDSLRIKHPKSQKK